MSRFKELDPAAFSTAPLRNRTIAVLGYGSQGHAHAQNLRDGGHEVVIGQRPGGRGWQRAIDDGWEPLSLADAADAADYAVLCLPDGAQPTALADEILPALRPGSALVFVHGFNIRFGGVQPPDGIDTILVAPKGVGPAVRAHYEAGRGVPVLIGVERDSTGTALDRAAAYAIGITRGAAGMWRCTLADECDTDLFGEQAVLCGGLPALMEMAFETLVEAGYPPEMAYFECCHEVKLIADLMDRVGVEGLLDWISDTAAFGGVSRGGRLINDDTRREMRAMIGEIRSGAFAEELAGELDEGKPATSAMAEARHASQLARVGAAVRARVHAKE